MNIKRSTIRSLAILWLIIGYFSNGFAQSISNYQFSTNTTSSLNRTKGSLVDDIDMNIGTTILVGGSLVNSIGSILSPIGFDFYINGTRQTQFNVTSNGWLSLAGSVAPATTFNSGAGIRMSPFLTGSTVMGTSSIGRVHYKVVGSQPNRVLVVEYLRMAINSSVVNDTNTFQVRLYENDGSIEFVYGRMEVGAGAPISYNVGFQFNSGVFQHVNTTTNLASTSASTANVANSTGPIAGLSNRVPGSQRAYLWTPIPISDPQPVSITNITTTGMTVNWANVTNEVGYALYRSTDGGVSYSFVSTFGVNTTTFNATGLVASTTYDWRVYAIRESVSAPADGTGTTSAATRFFTTSSGFWSDPAIWNTLSVPSGADTAEISTGHTVELDAASISSGTLIANGRLNYWASTTQQTLTVNGDLIINNGGAVTAGTGSGPAALTGPHILNVGGNAATSTFSGNVVVNGTLNLQTTASVQLRLNGTSNATVTGNADTCSIPFILVNKGGSPINVDNTVEFLRTFTQPNTAGTYTNTQRFLITSGTLKISAPIVVNSIHTAQLALFNPPTAGINSRFWLNHPGINIGMIPTATNQGTLNISNGELLISNGTLTLGTGANGHNIVQNVRLKMDGGNLNLQGSLNLTNISTAELEINGGVLSIDPQGAGGVVSNFTTVFTVGAASRFVFTGGEIQIVDPHSTAVFNTTINTINIPTGGIKSVTGGKFVIGNGATAPSGGTVSTLSGFSLNIQIPIHKLELRNDTTVNPSRYCRIAADLTINDSLILTPNSYLRTASVTGFNLNVNGAVLNNGRISGVLPQSTTATASGAINFTGTSAQTVTGTGNATVLVTRIANASGVTFNNTATWAHERFTLEQGNVTNAINSITIGGFNYRGNIVIGGLNETTASGSFTNLPTIVTTGGLPNYTYGPSSTALVMGSANEMASGSLNANALTINDAQGVTSNRNINVQILNLTSGNLNIANNSLTIGTSASNPGSLTRSNGFVQLGNTGQFTRWFAIGASPAFEYTTGFPLATSSSERSVLWSLNGGTLTGGGNLTVRHNNIIGITDLSPSFSDGGITINRRTNAFWSISSSTAGSFNIGTSNLSLRIIGAGTGAVTNAAELQLVKQNGVAGGTAVVSAGTNARPELNRDFSQANITGGALFDDFYIGANSAINPLSPTIIAIQTGNWNDPTTWEGNVVPTLSNFATIASGVTVTIPASVTAACNGLNIQAGATLNANSGTLNSANAILLDGTLNAAGTSVNVLAPALNGLNIGTSGNLNVSGGTFNIGTIGGGNNTMAVSGGLTISGGTLTVNGNVTLTSTSSFSQSGGDFNIDPNSGSAPSSVASGTHILLIQTSNLTCTNGTITIVDPPHNSVSNTNSIRIAVSTGSLSAFSGTHVIRFGNGTSIESGNTNGFSINTRASSGIVPLQNVRVSGGNTTGRWTSSSFTGGQGTYIKGNLTIDAGSEFRHTTAVTCAIGGNIINNGILTVSTTTANSFILGTDGNYPLSNAQDISGSGTFRNNTNTPTGAFTNLYVNNGVGLTLSTTNTVFTVTGTLRIDALRITTNTNTIGLGASSTFTRTSGYIIGNLAKNFTTGSNISRVFEIGNATNFLPVNVTMNQVTTAGSISVGLNTGEHPTIATSCINPTKSINNYWKVTNLGVVTSAAGGTYVFNFLTSDVDPSTNLNNAKLFSYSGTDWLAGLNPASTSSTSFTVNNLNNFGDIAIGEINPIPTSVAISATSTDICVGSSVTFTANVTNGGAAPTYQWKLNGTNIGGATASTYVTTTLNNQDTITCDIVSNNPCVVVTNATSNKIGIKVSPLTVGGTVSSAATICSGSTSGVLTLSGHTGDVVRWESSTSPTFSTVTTIANTSTTYTSGPLTTTTYFRAVVKSGACAEANSASVQITVNPTSVGGTVSSNQAICAGGTIAALTLSGNTGNVTTWQSSADAGFTTPTNISGTAGLTSFTPTGVTSTTFYRAVVQSGVCPTANSSSATITVTPASVGGTVSSNQTICAGGTVTALTLTGNTGNVTTWQSSADAGFTTPTNISGTSGLTSFTPTGVTSTTFYRAVVQSGSCATANSSSATITVNPLSVGGTVSSNQTICVGGTISALTLSGNVGTVVNWQSSANAGFTSPTNISGTAGLTSFTPTGVTSTTFYRAVVQSGSCATANSSSASITVTPASVGGTVSSNQTICPGGAVTALSLTGNTGTVVNWQSSADAGFTTPTNISGTAGLTSFTPTGVTSTTFYRAVVQSGSCATANSSSATITVTPASVGGTVSSNQTICPGGAVTALSLTGNTGNVTTWQSSADAGFTTPTNISGTAGLTSFTPTGVTSTTFYRAVVQSGSCATANSSSASITVTPASVGGTVSSNQTICAGGTVTALTLTGNTGNVTTWQSSADAGFTTPTNISGTAGLTSFTPTGVTSTTFYRAVVQSGSCATANSSSATITVTPASVGGTVSSNQTICAGGTVTALTLTGNTGNVTTWQSSADAGFTTPTNISGTAGLTSFTPTGVTSTTFYRAVVQSGSCATANSSSATITVTPASVGGTVSSNQTICAGGTISALTLSGNVGTVVNWQSSADAGFTTPTNISGTAGLTSFTPTGVTSTTFYRAVVQSGSCATANSSSATITVTPASVGGTVSSNQTICAGGTVTALTLTGNTGNVTTWQSSADAGFTTPTNISGTAGLTSFTPTGVTSTTFYRAVVQSGSCATANSSSATITVNPASVGGTVSSNQTICLGGTISALNLSGNVGTVVTWQSSTDAGFTTPTNISGTAGLTSFTPTGVTSTTFYRAVVQSGSCASANSSSATITVTPASVGGTVSSNQTICAGGAVTALTLTGNTGNVTTWQSSTDAGFTTPTNISGTAGLTSFTPSGLTSTTFYRAVVQSGTCATANSSSATITVNPASVGGTVSSNQTICVGGTISTLNLSGNVGTVVTWQSSANAGFTTPTNISGTVGLTSFTPTGVTSTTFYRAVVQNGSCASANSSSASITVNTSSVGGTVSSDQTICALGSVSALTLSGNVGSVVTWQSASDLAFTSPTNISGTAGLTSFTPTGVTTTTYYRAVVQNGSCASANSSAALITVSPASVGGTVGSNQTVCSGSTPSQLTLTGNVGNVTTWQSSTDAGFTSPTNISGTAGQTTFTPSALTTTTYFRAVIQSGGCSPANSVAALITVTPGSVGGSVSGTSAVCSGQSATLTLSGNTGNVVNWESATAPFITYSPITNTTTILNTSALTQTTRFRAVVQSGSCPSATSSFQEVIVTSGGVWTGTSSGNWGDASNWCGGVPTSSTNVVIPAGTPNAPIINVAATANNLTIDAGASLAFTGTNSITISGDLTVNGTFTTTGGSVVFNGTAAQNVAGVTYNNLTLSGSGNKTLTGNATVNGTLNLSGGLLVLSNSNLTIGTGASITGGSASNYIQTNGSGALFINNLSATPRTYPVGVGGTYNPVTIANSGTADNISVRLLDQVYTTYTGEVGSGVIAGNVVNRTFIINEAVAGGSNLNITFQWNASNELTMSRAQTIVGRYNGGVWSNISGAPSAASGSGPFTYSISTTNTGIFGVGDVNSPLPVRLISFEASLKRGVTKLTWTTASEINNSHFVVERGIDGYNFEAIGQVKGRGNSSVRVDYAFDDVNVNDIISTNGVVYYRLKQVGFSGNTEYSGIVSVAEFNNVMFELVNAVPNPFNDQTSISFKTSSVANVKVEITDAFGKVVQVYNVQPTEGANKLDIQLNDQSFAAGVYFVRLQQNEQSQVIRIVKR